MSVAAKFNADSLSVSFDSQQILGLCQTRKIPLMIGDTGSHLAQTQAGTMAPSGPGQRIPMEIPGYRGGSTSSVKI